MPEIQAVAETYKRVIEYGGDDSEYVEVDVNSCDQSAIASMLFAAHNVSVGNNPDDGDDLRFLTQGEELPVFVDVGGHGYENVGFVSGVIRESMLHRLRAFAMRCERGGMGRRWFPLITLDECRGVYFLELL